MTEFRETLTSILSEVKHAKRVVRTEHRGRRVIFDDPVIYCHNDHNMPGLAVPYRVCAKGFKDISGQPGEITSSWNVAL